jgi:hypothetical protein
VTRTAIAVFAGAIAATFVARLWARSGLPQGAAVFTGGLVLGGVLWLLEAYYGYRAIQGGPKT